MRWQTCQPVPLNLSCVSRVVGCKIDDDQNEHRNHSGKHKLTQRISPQPIAHSYKMWDAYHELLQIRVLFFVLLH